MCDLKNSWEVIGLSQELHVAKGKKVESLSNLLDRCLRLFDTILTLKRSAIHPPVFSFLLHFKNATLEATMADFCNGYKEKIFHFFSYCFKFKMASNHSLLQVFQPSSQRLHCSVYGLRKIFTFLNNGATLNNSDAKPSNFFSYLEDKIMAANLP